MGEPQRATPSAASNRPYHLPPRGPDGKFVANPRRSAAPLDLSDHTLYLNRELSWLEYNRRVLALASDASAPLLERLRFLAIFHANLDEFFMVRVAGLKRQVQAGVTTPTPDGRTPAQQLAAIARRVRSMVAAATTVLHEELFRLLHRHGVSVVSMADLDGNQRAAAGAYFEHQVFPVLTPLAVDPGHPFPYISNLSISLAVTVRDHRRNVTQFARVKVPKVLPRFVVLDDGAVFVPLEDVIRTHLDRLFPRMEVLDAHTFRVTRNADLELEEEGADDLLMAIEEELRKRRFGAVVRLEVDSQVPDHVTRLLRSELGVTDHDTYRVTGLLGCEDLVELAELDRYRLRWRQWQPVPPPRLRHTAANPPDIFAEIREGDLLVHHPYDSFGHSVERFFVQASEDPDVLAIKQTLYRTSGDSPIVDALIQAAERGKQVVALVELKARFDEEANIIWARELERAGVHVVYGLAGLTTHAKAALVVRRERDGLRRYVHIGTGNYNSKTARLYSDIGLFSCNPALGSDLTELFNALTGYGRQVRYRKLLVAPWRMRERILELIERETTLHREQRRAGLIRICVNSLIDTEMIGALYQAARAGVQVQLVIRGICGLRPGIAGISDRIRVVSIVGRFLEHARILQFGPDDFFIGSADLMPRNLDRRVEIMLPVEDPDLRDRLRTIIDTMLADNSSAWRLGAGGSWSRIRPRGTKGEARTRGRDAVAQRAAMPGSHASRNSQEQFMAQALQAYASAPVT